MTENKDTNPVGLANDLVELRAVIDNGNDPRE